MIDDAGAGFASLRHVLGLHPDVIKLDLSLTRTIDSDPVRRALAASLVAFAREIGATIVAEGIETRAELEALRALGVTHGQGYYLARPAGPGAWAAGARRRGAGSGRREVARAQRRPRPPAGRVAASDRAGLARVGTPPSAYSLSALPWQAWRSAAWRPPSTPR
jgi:hypothetical protein